jgi:hypothetical protein
LDITPAVLPATVAAAPGTPSGLDRLDGVEGSDTRPLVAEAPERFVASIAIASEPGTSVIGFDLADADGDGWRLEVVRTTGEARRGPRPYPSSAGGVGGGACSRNHRRADSWCTRTVQGTGASPRSRMT